MSDLLRYKQWTVEYLSENFLLPNPMIILDNEIDTKIALSFIDHNLTSVRIVKYEKVEYKWNKFINMITPSDKQRLEYSIEKIDSTYIEEKDELMKFNKIFKEVKALLDAQEKEQKFKMQCEVLKELNNERDS